MSILGVVRMPAGEFYVAVTDACRAEATVGPARRGRGSSVAPRSGVQRDKVYPPLTG